MNKILINILFLVSLTLPSCGDNETVDIVSLNTFGNKVCLNGIVKVFVSAEIAGDATYEWGCDSGIFTNPQGLFENVWQAPDTPGEYEIWVTVKSGGSKQTRQAKMTVLNEYFYSDFETPYFNEGFGVTNMTQVQDAASGSVKLTATKDIALWYRNWNDKLLVPPYSVQAKYSPLTFKAGNTINFRITFSPVAGQNKDIRNIVFTVDPLSGKWVISYTYYDINKGQTQVSDVDTGTDEVLKSLKKWNHISVSLNKEMTYIVYVEGKKLIESNVLRVFQSLLPVKGFEVSLSAKSVSLLDDLFVITNGEICNATERVR